MQSQNQTLVPNLKVIEFLGNDSIKFLQGQLTCDVEKLKMDSCTWGGYLNNKGRLLATFFLYKKAFNEIYLIMEEELTYKMLDKISMYYLRADTKGFQSNYHVFASLKRVQNAHRITKTTYIRLVEETEAVVNKEALNKVYIDFVKSGCPWLVAPLFEKFTAHNMSLDLVKGVDLDKGCYVGQEIFIRSHHRGYIKKRAFIIAGEGKKPEDGAEILSEKHAGQSAGNFIYGVNTDNGFIGIACLRKDAVSSKMELVDGREITATEPPYGLVDKKFEKK